MPDIALDYKVTAPTLRRFLQSQAFVTIVMGPFGSGKTTACIIRLLMAMATQQPGPDGKRRTRFGIIRNTQPELMSTTIPSFKQWMPDGTGKWTFDSPIRFVFARGDVEAEFWFVAMDNEADVRKLLSMELTAAYANELRELPKGVLDALTGRVGRFPPRRDGGATWSGVIADTNPCDVEHWIYRMAEVDRPEGFAFFKQPSGRSPEAENLEHLPDGYYARLAAGKDPDWVAVYVDGEWGYIVDGKPVYPSFRDSVHVAPEPLAAVQSLPLLIGADFGLTPAAIIGQRLPDGRWQILDELVTDDTGTVRFAEALSAYVARQYPNFQCEGWGDPAGAQRSQVDERSCLDIMKARTPWRWHAAPDNALALRLESVKGTLNRLVDGRPGFLMSPKCAVLRKGFNGGYCYKAIRTGNGAAYHDKPDKNAYSHPHDALQYLLSGGGEAAVVLRRQNNDDLPKFADLDYPVFGNNY